MMFNLKLDIILDLKRKSRWKLSPSAGGRGRRQLWGWQRWFQDGWRWYRGRTPPPPSSSPSGWPACLLQYVKRPQLFVFQLRLYFCKCEKLICGLLVNIFSGKPLHWSRTKLEKKKRLKSWQCKQHITHSFQMIPLLQERYWNKGLLGV